MNSLKDTALESNPYLKINFDGGDLSSDAGLLLIKEFAEKIGLVKLVYRLFKTNDDALFRIHIDPENLLQVIYQTMAAYFEDDCADELTVDPTTEESLLRSMSPVTELIRYIFTSSELDSKASIFSCILSKVISLLKTTPSLTMMEHAIHVLPVDAST